jgi:hypothetical protein
MEDAGASKISVEAMILTTPVGLYCTDFGVKKTLNMGLKSVENMLNIRLVFDQINPGVATIIINKTDLILKTSRKR